MQTRWLIRRFRTGPQSEPRGHVSSTRDPVAGVRLASEGVRSLPPVAPVAERRGGFARGRASTPIRTGSARAIAPPPGSPGAATDSARPHRCRVRQTSLPRHSGGRSTERPCRFVVDHTARPSPAVPSRERTPAGHDQHRHPARNPLGAEPERPSIRSEHYLADAVADQCARIHRLAPRSLGRPLHRLRYVTAWHSLWH